MYSTLWRRRVQEAVGQQLRSRVLAAFNTNVDVIVHITGEKLSSMLAAAPHIDVEAALRKSIMDIDSVKTEEDFITVLADRLSKGKSFHIVTESDQLLSLLDRHFRDELESMGGQAGIIANQMSVLGASSTIYTRLLSPIQARMFRPGVKTPIILNGKLELRPVSEVARENDRTKINWIFEYAKDEEFRIGSKSIKTPRANRVILATRPKEAIMSFSDSIRPFLGELARLTDVTFLAGYHYADYVIGNGQTYEDYMDQAVADLAVLRNGNPGLRMHYEYVPMKVRELERRTLKTICSQIKSFGVNENEIKRILDEFGFEELFVEIQQNERAYSLYKGALALLRELELDRIQVHNLGYYVLVLRKPYAVSPEKVRMSCLYASAVNAIKAKYGGYVTPDKLRETYDMGLSPIGFEQMRGFLEEIKNENGAANDMFLADGILEFPDHYVLVVPAHVVPDPVSTVGMGDTISSAAFAMECNPPN